MTQDYAKQRAPSQSPRVASWVWLFTSLVTGSFIAFIYYLIDIAPQADQFSREIARHAEQRSQTESSAPSASKVEKDERPRYTFYNELARRKMVPRSFEEFLPRLSKEEKKKVAREKKEARKRDKATQSNYASQPSNNIKNPNALSRYLLQTGSFKSPSDADRRRAELLLMGMEANIRTVTFANGQIWHRVLVGPYNGETAVNNAKNQLARLNIETQVRKIN